MVGRQQCQAERESKRGGLWLKRSRDRPSQGKYGRRFSLQSLSRAIKPLIGVKLQPSVQFSPVLLCNLKPVLTLMPNAPLFGRLAREILVSNFCRRS